MLTSVFHHRQSSAVFGSDGLTLRRWIVYGGIFSFLAVGTNYSYVRALGVSKPSDVTALFASNSAFVFLLSCAVLGAQILSLKVCHFYISCGFRVGANFAARSFSVTASVFLNARFLLSPVVVCGTHILQYSCEGRP